MEEQEDSTEAHTVRRPSSMQDSEGQVEGQNALQVGRLVHSNRDDKRSSLQAAQDERRRRALHVEHGHAPEVLHLNRAEAVAFCSFFSSLFYFGLRFVIYEQ
jgi:hypothetical protein